MSDQKNTIESFFTAAGDRESQLRELDAITRTSAPSLEPVVEKRHVWRSARLWLGAVPDKKHERAQQEATHRV